MKLDERTEIEYCKTEAESGWTILVSCNDVGTRCVDIGIPISSALVGKIPLGSCFLNYQIRIDAVGSDRFCDEAAALMGESKDRRYWIHFDFGRYGFNRDVDAVRTYFGDKAAHLIGFIFPNRSDFSLATVSNSLELTMKLIPRLKEKELILGSHRQRLAYER